MAHKISSTKRELTAVFFVLFSGILAGLIFSFWLLSQYGATGQYLAEQVLIDPDYFHTFFYIEPSREGGQPRRFSLKKVELRSWDENRQTWNIRPIGENAYRNFFNHVKGEKSILNPSLDIETAFSKQFPEALYFWTEEEGKKDDLSLFLEVDFLLKEHIFRVMLRSGPAPYAYFHYPDGWQQF